MGCTVLIALVKRHLAVRQAESNLRRHRLGWDWAAGELLRGTPVMDVLQKAEAAQAFEDFFDQFDNGVIDACNAWEVVHAK